MKKLLALIFVFILGTVVVGCSQNSQKIQKEIAELQQELQRLTNLVWQLSQQQKTDKPVIRVVENRKGATRGDIEQMRKELLTEIREEIRQLRDEIFNERREILKMLEEKIQRKRPTYVYVSVDHPYWYWGPYYISNRVIYLFPACYYYYPWPTIVVYTWVIWKFYYYRRPPLPICTRGTRIIIGDGSDRNPPPSSPPSRPSINRDPTPTPEENNMEERITKRVKDNHPFFWSRKASTSMSVQNEPHTKQNTVTPEVVEEFPYFVDERSHIKPWDEREKAQRYLRGGYGGYNELESDWGQKKRSTEGPIERPIKTEDRISGEKTKTWKGSFGFDDFDETVNINQIINTITSKNKTEFPIKPRTGQPTHERRLDRIQDIYLD